MANEELDEAALSREIDIHNQDQERIAARAQDLLKVLLALSGGALAVCASFFSAGVNLHQLPQLIGSIQTAWIALTASIVLFGVTMTIMLAQDAQFATYRARYLNDPHSGQQDSWAYWVPLSWVVGVSGLLAFIFGMAAFCWAAYEYLAAQL